MNSTHQAIEISNLTVRFGTFTAVDDISFSVNKGEIFGFLGANGAGKTTAIRVMCGLLVPTEGEVRVAGIDIRSGTMAVKEKIGYLSQKFTLYDDLTVSENLLFKASLRKLDDAYFRKRMSFLLDFIGYTQSVDILVRDLPSGIKQQASLAASLLHDPEILFLDEPTSGVSPRVRKLFWALIRRLAAEGKTVIVTTHYLDEAEECGRIALMRTGEIVALGSPAELEKSAYPEPLVELSADGKIDRSVAESLKQKKEVIRLWPYGMRYHAALRDKNALAPFLAGLPGGIRAREIPPTLEDVFIRIMEG